MRMHDLDPVFSAFSRSAAPGRRGRRRSGSSDPLLLQSMYIFKQPRIGGEVDLPPGRDVPLHRPDDVRRLLVRARGRHARERLPVGRARRSPRAAAEALRARRGRRHRVRELDDAPLPEPGDGRLVPFEAPAGTMVLLHGQLPHYSGAEPLAEVTPRVLVARDRRRRRVPRRQLAAAR